MWVAKQLSTAHKYMHNLSDKELIEWSSVSESFKSATAEERECVDNLMSLYVIDKQFTIKCMDWYLPDWQFSPLLSSHTVKLCARGLMCLLMFYVTEIDGVEGQWVAQLCGCKASSPLSACQKTEACQQLCVCVCVCLLESVYLCASTVCECWYVCVCVWHGDSLLYCQQLSTSQVSSRYDTCWPRARTGHTGDDPDGWWQLGVCVCVCVCVCLFVFVCAICVKTNLSHMYSFTLWIYELSRHLCVHACRTAMSVLDPKELTGSFGKGLEKRERGEREGSPGHFDCCLTDKWAQICSLLCFHPSIHLPHTHSGL